MRRTVTFVASFVLFTAFTVAAQENRSEISVQGTGFFTRDSSGNGSSYSTTDTGGVLATYRYHLKPWLSAEGAYGIDRDTQKYFASATNFRIQSDIHQATAALIFNLPPLIRRRFSPYVLAGGGALVFDPTSNLNQTVSAAQTQARGTFVYGVGVNYPIVKRLSLRAEYRGLVYSTPDFGFSGLRTNAMTHTAQPSIGFSFRF